ncbi:hypothetical protein [Streptomyces antibioticus]|uniref:hypothetical protein n=1 Tax=Streptomyces antibioticus TaxID=1890 RepID=UPI0036DD93CB
MAALALLTGCSGEKPSLRARRFSLHEQMVVSLVRSLGGTLKCTNNPTVPDDLKLGR